MWAVRSVKSELEIERIRKACDINIRAFEKAFTSVQENMTELELFRYIACEMFRLGADDVFPLGIRAGADRYGHANCPPGDRPIGRQEIILIDGGPGYRGYFSDIIRLACIGPPSSRQTDLMNVAIEACVTGVEAVKPGVTPAQICETVDQFSLRSHFAGQYVSRGMAGHALGLDIQDRKSVV